MRRGLLLDLQTARRSRVATTQMVTMSVLEGEENLQPHGYYSSAFVPADMILQELDGPYGGALSKFLDTTLSDALGWLQ